MEKELAHIIPKCFVNVPFVDFDKYKGFIRTHRINPEIGLDGNAVYDFSEQDFKATKTFLDENNLRCTLHAPFHDMLPGARDSKILEVTRAKLRRCFELIEIFKPCSVVCHLGYLDWVHSYDFDQWLENSLETWQDLLTVAENSDVPVMFENTYEPTPRIHRLLFESLDSPAARFCLDTGHLLAFAQAPWPDWLSSLEHRLGQLHLHDNHGFRDEHLPVGKGDFDFAGLFARLRSEKTAPIVTLEPRSENDLWDSLNALDRLNLFDHKIG